MESKKDTFGQMLLTKDSYDVIERDDGLISFEPSKQYFDEYSKWPKMEREAVKLVKGAVLDMGSGAGRVALHLQKKGIDVTAADNSPLSLKACRIRGVKKTRLLPIEKIGSVRPGEFNTIIMFGNNFGLFGSFRKARTLLKKIHKVTGPEGLIIAETSDPHRTKNPVHKAYHRQNIRKDRMPGQVRIRVRFGTGIGGWFDYLFVSKKEMKAILKGTGWEVIRFIDSEGSGYIAVIGKE